MSTSSTASKAVNASSKRPPVIPSVAATAVAAKDGFHWKIWSFFTAENIILDFGRPIAMIYCHSDLFPLNRPSVGDYFHMAYNVFTALAIFQLYLHTGGASHKRSMLAVMTLLCLFVMGASIHLVGDSINHRLALLGYQHHLSLRDNEIMKNLQPKELVESFDLLYFYDEQFGHLLWYIPLFLLQFLYFTKCFQSKKQALQWQHWALILLNGLYHWYLGTEGQITPLLIAFYLSMHATVAYRRSHGNLHLDNNGKFLLHTMTVALTLTTVWVAFLWEEPSMRQKYSGWFYVPEPWSYYSLKWGIS